MCNNYKLEVPISQLDLTLGEPLAYPGGVPNFPPNPDIRIGDRAPVVVMEDGSPALIALPWAWKSPQGRPVFNFRSEGRSFAASTRCLIPADGFYEFTAAEPGHTRKTRWLFTPRSDSWFWIAGIVKDGAFAMLTQEPGPQVAPYHSRQIVTLDRDRGREWLGPNGQPGVLSSLEGLMWEITKVYPA